MRYAQDLCLGSMRIDVPLVDIISQDTGDSNKFCTGGAGDGQEEQDEHCCSSGLSKKGSSSSGSWKSSRDLGGSEDGHCRIATKSDC